MNIHYEVVEVYPDLNQVVVRYFTDILTVEHLTQTKNPDSNGKPLRCFSDRAITLPIPVPSGSELEKIILMNCNWMELEQGERRVLSEQQNDEELISAKTNISKLNSLSGTINHSGSPTTLESNLLKLEADVMNFYVKAIGFRNYEYDLAEAEAKKFKDAGYQGSAPLLEARLESNTKGLATLWECADDILKKAESTRTLIESVRVHRLICKKELTENNPLAMENWNTFLKNINL